MAASTQEQRYQWRWNDVIYLIGTSLAAVALGALVIGTVVVLGGAVLLAAAPILLLMSPLWIPPVLIALTIGGGTLFCTGGGLGVAAVVSWIYQAVLGKQPPPERKPAVTKPGLQEAKLAETPADVAQRVREEIGSTSDALYTQAQLYTQPKEYTPSYASNQGISGTAPLPQYSGMQSEYTPT